MSISPAQGVIPAPVIVSGEVETFKRSQAEPRVRERSPAQEPASRNVSKVDAAKEEARVENATQLLNEFMKHAAIGLRFSTEQDSGQIVVRVVSKQTGELIRQIPSEEALKLSKALDTLQGLIIQEKA